MNAKQAKRIAFRANRNRSRLKFYLRCVMKTIRASVRMGKTRIEFSFFRTFDCELELFEVKALTIKLKAKGFDVRPYCDDIDVGIIITIPSEKPVYFPNYDPNIFKEDDGKRGNRK